MKKILLLLCLSVLFSCQKTTYTTTIKDFANNRWPKNEIKTFTLKLKKDVEVGEVELHFSHVIDPQYDTVPLSVVITHPSGEQENIYVNMQLKDASGDSLSECTGDICDYKTVIKEGSKLAKGTYKITVQNQFPHEYLPNILAFGVSISHDYN